MIVRVLFLVAVLGWVPSSPAQTAKPMSVAELAAYNKPDREKVLYEGAKKEGRLMWYTSLTGGPNSDAPKVFEAKYPGVNSKSIAATAMRSFNAFCKEAQAKRFLVDPSRRLFRS